MFFLSVFSTTYRPGKGSYMLLSKRQKSKIITKQNFIISSSASEPGHAVLTCINTGSKQQTFVVFRLMCSSQAPPQSVLSEQTFNWFNYFLTVSSSSSLSVTVWIH